MDDFAAALRTNVGTQLRQAENELADAKNALQRHFVTRRASVESSARVVQAAQNEFARFNAASADTNKPLFTLMAVRALLTLDQAVDLADSQLVIAASQALQRIVDRAKEEHMTAERAANQSDDVRLALEKAITDAEKRVADAQVLQNALSGQLFAAALAQSKSMLTPEQVKRSPPADQSSSRTRLSETPTWTSPALDPPPAPVLQSVPESSATTSAAVASSVLPQADLQAKKRKRNDLEMPTTSSPAQAKKARVDAAAASSRPSPAAPANGTPAASTAPASRLPQSNSAAPTPPVLPTKYRPGGISAAATSTAGATVPAARPPQPRPSARQSVATPSDEPLPAPAPIGPSLQSGTCREIQNLGLPLCYMCLKSTQQRRISGIQTDAVVFTCRFKGLRWIDPTNQTDPPETSFPRPDFERMQASMVTADSWNVKPSAGRVDRVKALSARKLVCVLEDELSVIKQAGAMFRARLPDEHFNCDSCSVTLLTRAWFCRTCGRQICAACHATYLALPPAPANQDLSTSYRCIPSQTRVHAHAPDHVPLSFFAPQELEAACTAMRSLVGPLANSMVPSSIVELPTRPPPPERIPALPSLLSPVSAPAAQAAFAKTEPFIVASVLSEATAAAWTPAALVRLLTQRSEPLGSVSVADCEKGSSRRMDAPAFFGMLGTGGESHSLKLDFFPSEMSLDELFPGPYQALVPSLPLQDVMLPNGVLNLASHLPRTHAEARTMLPGMWAGTGSSFEPGTKGTTALTFERSDSASVLVWSGPERPKPTPSTSRASSSPDNNQTGSPAPVGATPFGATGPGVLWHIFPPEPLVVGAIRRFLISLKPAKGTRVKRSAHLDPLQSLTSWVYLDPDLLEQLRQTAGIVPKTIVQRVGEVVVLPAGSVYQVCNLSDTINISFTFVSPRTAERAEELEAQVRFGTESDGGASVAMIAANSSTSVNGAGATDGVASTNGAALANEAVTQNGSAAVNGKPLPNDATPTTVSTVGPLREFLLPQLRTVLWFAWKSCERAYRAAPTTHSTPNPSQQP